MESNPPSNPALLPGSPQGGDRTFSRQRRRQGEDKVKAERLVVRAGAPKAVISEQRDGGAARTGDKEWEVIGFDDGGRNVPSLRRTLPG